MPLYPYGADAPEAGVMRSLLFVPADSPRKLEKSLASAADGLIFDLEDAVAANGKQAARQCLADFLTGALGVQGRETKSRPKQQIFVRVNDLESGQTLDDMAAVMQFRPDGLVLPKCRGGEDVRTLSLYLDAFEKTHPPRQKPARIIAIATETASAVFNLSSYKNVSPRLWGLMWGAEDLSADLGAMENMADGRWTAAFSLARTMCLLAAADAGVIAIDTVPTEIGNPEALLQETLAARRDGFGAKAAIHPGQLDVINQALAPSQEDLVWAQRVIAAFAGGDGVASLDGRMLDRPHLRLAKRVLLPD